MAATYTSMTMPFTEIKHYKTTAKTYCMHGASYNQAFSVNYMKLFAPNQFIFLK